MPKVDVLQHSPGAAGPSARGGEVARLAGQALRGLASGVGASGAGLALAGAEGVGILARGAGVAVVLCSLVVPGALGATDRGHEQRLAWLGVACACVGMWPDACRCRLPRCLCFRLAGQGHSAGKAQERPKAEHRAEPAKFRPSPGCGDKRAGGVYICARLCLLAGLARQVVEVTHGAGGALNVSLAGSFRAAGAGQARGGSSHGGAVRVLLQAVHKAQCRQHTGQPMHVEARLIATERCAADPVQVPARARGWHQQLHCHTLRAERTRRMA